MVKCTDNETSKKLVLFSELLLFAIITIPMGQCLLIPTNFIGPYLLSALAMLLEIHESEWQTRHIWEGTIFSPLFYNIISNMCNMSFQTFYLLRTCASSPQAFTSSSAETYYKMNRMVMFHTLSGWKFSLSLLSINNCANFSIPRHTMKPTMSWCNQNQWNYLHLISTPRWCGKSFSNFFS